MCIRNFHCSWVPQETIGLNDNRCNIVVLEISLHKRPSRVVDTVRDIRSRIVHVDPDLVKHALGAELATIWRGRLCDPVGEEDCDLSRMEANCLWQRKLAVGKQAERWACTIQRALHVARVEQYETRNVAGAGV